MVKQHTTPLLFLGGVAEGRGACLGSAEGLLAHPFYLLFGQAKSKDNTDTKHKHITPPIVDMFIWKPLTRNRILHASQAL